MEKKEIGGYISLDTGAGEEFHKEAIKLDSGRNCFKYILKAQNVSKVYLPYYISGSMVEPFKEVKIDYEFYHINKTLELSKEIEVKDNEKIVCVNYFTLKTQYINSMIDKYGDRIIVDNTHAFFLRPVPGIDTIYSPSKYIGVSDGGYLYTDHELQEEFSNDVSWKRAVHLFGRIDEGAEQFYKKFRESEDDLRYKKIRHMSNLTSHLLSSVDYRSIKLKRERNFYFLHSQLSELNELNINFSIVEGPFVYPLLIKHDGIREFLIQNKIYTATYWPRLLEIPEATDDELMLTKYILPLPIDQRYDLNDMNKIVHLIRTYLQR